MPTAHEPRPRPVKPDKGYSGEAMSDARRMWMDLYASRIMLYRSESSFFDDIPEDDEERRLQYQEVMTNAYGDEMNLMFLGNRNNRHTLRLTGYTEPELDALQDFLNTVIEAARPVVQRRDKIAKELFDEYGIDSFPRLYRGIPKVFVRPGEEPLYSESLRRRPFGILEVDGRIRIEPLTTRVEREMVEREQANLLTQDGEPKDGESPGVDEVAEPASLAPPLPTPEASTGSAAPDPRGD